MSLLRMPDGPGEPAVEAELAEVLPAVAAAGFGHAGVDRWSVAAAAEDAGDLLAASGLGCSDVGVLRVGEPGPTLAVAGELAGLAGRVGARLCVTSLDADPEVPGVRRLLAECADVLGAAGARLAIEFLPYTPLATLAAARELCAALGPERCGVLLDAWMFFASGADWAGLSATDPAEIAYLQVDDAPPPAGPDLVHESRHRRVLPGDGVLALGRFVAVLREAGYDGFVSCEVLSPAFRGLGPEKAAAVARMACLDLFDLPTGKERT